MSNTSFTAAWLAQAPRAVALLPRSFDDPAARARAVGRAGDRRIHPVVLQAFAITTDAQRSARDTLARPGSVCVVTGQQAGLFGGPLYTIYKAAAAIVNARATAEETGRPCVPVFWLQNEDHDYDEIATCTVPVGDDLVRVTVPGRDADRGRSIAARQLGDGVDPALDGLAEALEGQSHGPEVIALLRRLYTSAATPDGAFQRLIHTLFAEHGLLVVDPAQASLAEAAAPIHHRAVAEAGPIAAALLERSAALEAAGYAVQVHVRPDAPLSFVHPDGATGPRYRVEPGGDRFRLCGTDRTIPATTVDAGPFSTSALLRPILQDSWLPTAAYVGGPGEIAYFAQLSPLYTHFRLPMPLVVPRARFRVLDGLTDRLLGQLGLTADALAAPRSTLLERIGRADRGRPSPAALEAALVEPITAACAAFTPHAAFDKGLAKAAAKTEATLVDVARRLVDRYRRTLARDDDVALARLDRVLVRLQPDGAPQERIHCWPGYGARYGIAGFVDAVLAATRPFDGDLRDLRP